MDEIRITKMMLRGGMQERNRRREVYNFNQRVKEYNNNFKKDDKLVISLNKISGFSEVKQIPKIKKTRGRFGWNDY